MPDSNVTATPNVKNPMYVRVAFPLFYALGIHLMLMSLLGRAATQPPLAWMLWGNVAAGLLLLAAWMPRRTPAGKWVSAAKPNMVVAVGLVTVCLGGATSGAGLARLWFGPQVAFILTMFVVAANVASTASLLVYLAVSTARWADVVFRRRSQVCADCRSPVLIGHAAGCPQEASSKIRPVSKAPVGGHAAGAGSYLSP